MGYTLGIGELITDIEIDGLDSYIRHDFESVTHSNLPKYGEPTDQSNQRWPSYAGWSEFSRFVGLNDFFFNKENGLMRNHPGCVPLTKDHKLIIDNANREFYLKYPNAKPGYSEDENWPKENGFAVRLEWLKYWVDWSLDNCKNPVFYNS